MEKSKKFTMFFIPFLTLFTIYKNKDLFLQTPLIQICCGKLDSTNRTHMPAFTFGCREIFVYVLRISVYITTFARQLYYMAQFTRLFVVLN